MNEAVKDDIAYLRQVAEQGQRLPLNGGEFGVLWGSLYALSAIYAYAVLIQLIDLPAFSIGLAFLLPIPVGGLAHLILARRMLGAPGALSFGNKTSAAAWMAVGVASGMLSVVLFTAFGLALTSIPAGYLFGALQAVVFAMYAVAYATTAQVSGDAKQYIFSAWALLTALISLLVMNSYQMFLVMAAGLMVSAVVPGLMTRTQNSSK